MTKFEQEIQRIYATISLPASAAHWRTEPDARAEARAQGSALHAAHRTTRIEHAGRPRRLLRPAAALLIALSLIGLANLGAAYYAPRYGQALAQVPLVGGIYGKALQYYGLVPQ
ncbi:MAG: hypothetical protein M3082_14825, partial [Candidatus Dormibacteraeota bacterium]|nr:hypothetical protein [Candidatus Dormibacteraeota bacterium]